MSAPSGFDVMPIEAVAFSVAAGDGVEGFCLAFSIAGDCRTRLIFSFDGTRANEQSCRLQLSWVSIMGILDQVRPQPIS